MKNRMKRKQIYIILLALAAGGACFALLVLLALGAKGKDSVMQGTETAPIYNHFPDVPETSQMQWCSRSSGGIGLVTICIYVFACYDHDISGELQEMTVGDECDDIEFYYVPDELKGQKWRRVENAEFAFQTGIKDSRKMYTQVYLNEAGTILYFAAVGD